MTFLISVLRLCVHREAYSNTWRSFIFVYLLSVEDFSHTWVLHLIPKWANGNIWSLMEKKALRTKEKAEQTHHVNTHTHLCAHTRTHTRASVMDTWGYEKVRTLRGWYNDCTHHICSTIGVFSRLHIKLMLTLTGEVKSFQTESLSEILHDRTALTVLR